MGHVILSVYCVAYISVYSYRNIQSLTYFTLRSGSPQNNTLMRRTLTRQAKEIASGTQKMGLLQCSLGLPTLTQEGAYPFWEEAADLARLSP